MPTRFDCVKRRRPGKAARARAHRRTLREHNAELQAHLTYDPEDPRPPPSSSRFFVELIRGHPLTRDPRRRPGREQLRGALTLPVPRYTLVQTRSTTAAVACSVSGQGPCSSAPISRPPLVLPRDVAPVLPTSRRQEQQFEELFGLSPKKRQALLTTPSRLASAPAPNQCSPDTLFIPVGVSPEAFSPDKRSSPAASASTSRRRLRFEPY